MKKLILLLLFIPLLFSCSKGESIKYNLDVSSNPSDGGDVSPISGQFEEGQEITLTAYPRMEFNFDKWTGSVSETSNPLKILMNSNKTVVANFTPKTPSRVKYELSEVWKDKIIFPEDDKTNKSYCGEYTFLSNPVYQKMMLMLKVHHYSIDSLIIDFSKIDGDSVKNLFIRDVTGTSAESSQGLPDKIGYIKIIGDTINKKLFWELKKYFTGDNWMLPVEYGDSNIDFSNLIYNWKYINTGNCSEPEKINFSKFFKKVDVIKNTFTSNQPYGGDYKVGDTIRNDNRLYKIHSIQYIYD